MRTESGHYAVISISSGNIKLLSWDNKDEPPSSIDGKELLSFVNEDSRIICVIFSIDGLSPHAFELKSIPLARWEMVSLH